MKADQIRRNIYILFASLLILCASTLAVSAGIGTDDHNLGNSKVTLGSIIPKITETGKFNLSVDGLGTINNTGTIRVLKPSKDATVKSAYLLSATTGETNHKLATGDIKINGNDVKWDIETPSSINSYNYWADVTPIVKPIVDADPAGTNYLTINEADTLNTDGEILAVLFNDPNQKTDNTYVLLFGAQDVNGDTFAINTANPIDTTNNLPITMGLGISYSYQHDPNEGWQYSTVTVNGQNLTKSAGGEDDGASQNGALLTVGGIGDSIDNPADPTALPTNPRSDDELYNILPFVKQGDSKISVYSKNPTMDDNILFAYFVLPSNTAVVGEGILLAPESAINVVGATHTVVAKVLDNSGNPVSGTGVTFEITDGPNKGINATATTDVNGTAKFSYTGTTAGTDTIIASFINNHGTQMTSNQVTNTWLQNSINMPPVAEAGPDQVVNDGSAVVLDGSGSTDDGNIAPLTYTWTWNGGSANGISPIITLPVGTTTVTLTVFDGQLSNNDTVNITVNPNMPPVAEAGPDQMIKPTTKTGASITLDGSGSTDDGKISPLTYSWTWNGGSATGVKPNIFLPMGTTKVTLTVFDGQFSSTDTVSITVKDSCVPNKAPIAEAGPNQVVKPTTKTGASITLDGSGSKDDGKISPLTYTWTWNGGSAKGVKPKIFLPLGTTKVTLKVFDGQFSSTDTVSITVKASPVLKPPVAAFSATPIKGKAPLTVKFTDKSTGVITSRSWNFGDKTTSTDKNPIHKYTKKGTYTVSLTVMNAAGKSIAKNTIYVTVK